MFPNNIGFLVFLHGSILGAILCTSLASFSSLAAQIKWTMIDVSEGEGQGDAHLLEFPDGVNYLIDVGRPGGGKLIPFLRQKKIEKIHKILISHGHEDHYGGLSAVLDTKIPIDEVYFNTPERSICDVEVPWGCSYQNLQDTLQTLKKAKIRIREYRVAEILYDSFGIVLKVLVAYRGGEKLPHATGGGSISNVNDTSVLLSLTNGKIRALFTGDLNNPLGTYLANHSKNLSADLLKVPHHGTEGVAPNSFYDRVGAKAAFVPSPPNLWLSDRSKRVREYFLKAKIPVFVSGMDGDVQILMGPKDWRRIN